MTGEIPKYKIGFSQSVSSGIIAFHAEVNTDNLEDIRNLKIILTNLEIGFKKDYLIASDIAPKEKGKKNGSK